MATYVKDFGLPTVGLTSDTITSQIVLPIRKDCTTGLLEDPCCGYNFNRCGNDKEYFQPICTVVEPAEPSCLTKGCTEPDYLYIQLQQPDNFNQWGAAPGTHGWVQPEPTGDWLATIRVYAWNEDCTIKDVCENAAYTDYVDAAFVGGEINGRTFQMIRLNTEFLPCKFYLGIEINYGSSTKIFYTEPYEKVPTCEGTVLLEGVYPETGRGSVDCNGFYYGEVPYTLGTSFLYRNLLRVSGVLEERSMEITRTESEGFYGRERVTSKTDSKRIFILRLRGVPDYVAYQLRTILMAKEIYINGYRYVFNGTVDKNNTGGTMWYSQLEFQLIDDCLQSEFDCV